eukprot:CAMPEP_0196580180 /NCGR_PEP_ID=MMETSP1081-20130531/27625_1 /TAXON_ID=36882 /ORGANISM="Pyramimonas amylifera, Strain CCMP720" /LENGTH=277 /DNA_ID=CAMNT_0041899985 /DNA_START=35 /DNA_END=868 /DNA_ORIENTATION=+
MEIFMKLSWKFIIFSVIVTICLLNEVLADCGSCCKSGGSNCTQAFKGQENGFCCGNTESSYFCCPRGSACQMSYHNKNLAGWTCQEAGNSLGRTPNHGLPRQSMNRYNRGGEMKRQSSSNFSERGMGWSWMFTLLVLFGVVYVLYRMLQPPRPALAYGMPVHPGGCASGPQGGMPPTGYSMYGGGGGGHYGGGGMSPWAAGGMGLMGGMLLSDMMHPHHGYGDTTIVNNYGDSGMDGGNTFAADTSPYGGDFGDGGFMADSSPMDGGFDGGGGFGDL